MSPAALLRVPLLGAALLALLALTGCASMVPLSHELRVEHGLSSADLKNLQYYVSDRITLRREVTSGGKQVTPGHKLVIVSGRVIEEVVIEQGTPGVAVEVGDGTIAVSFEPGSSLLFSAAPDPSSPPPPPPDPLEDRGFAEPPGAAPAPSRPARLVASGGAFSGDYWLVLDPGGSVVLGGTRFQAIDESSRAHLMIDAESLEEIVSNRKVLPGMRLPDHE